MEQQIRTRQAQQVQSTGNTGEVQSLQQIPVPETAQEKKLMRQPRSRKYIKALQGAANLWESSEEVKSAVQALPVNNKLIGILSQCGIPGCIIHAIDKSGNILVHYASRLDMGSDLRKGYMVYMASPGCVAAEVYTETICVINSDGSVKLIERTE